MLASGHKDQCFMKEAQGSKRARLEKHGTDIVEVEDDGKHEDCDASWCGYHKDPGNFTHKSLPHGKDLKDGKLQKHLEAVVEVFAKNAERLVHLGSSQANESLNNSTGSKAPKIRHYGASDSNDFRVA